MNVENVKCLESRAGIKWASLLFLFNTRMSTEAEEKAKGEGETKGTKAVGKKRPYPWQTGYVVKVGYEQDEEEKEINGTIFPEEHEKRMRQDVGEAFVEFVHVKVKGWYEKFLGEDWKEALAHLFVLSDRAKETGAIYDMPIFWKACFSLYQKLFTPSQQQDQDFLARRAKDWKEFFSREICPARQRHLFTWSYKCPWDKVKVVIIGQDPYPNRDHAHGLSFSAKKSIPKSLGNILNRLEIDYVSRYSDLIKRIGPDAPSIKAAYSEKLGQKIKHFPDHGEKFKGRSDGNFGAEMKARLAKKRFTGGDLTAWSDQGVLLLNASLTTMEKSPGLHADVWKPFTMEVLRALKGHPRFNNMVFILWGTNARTTFQDAFGVDYKNLTGKAAGGNGNSFINRVIISTHPSPFSALKNTKDAKAFMSTETFTRANDLLIMLDSDVVPINWMNLD